MKTTPLIAGLSLLLFATSLPASESPEALVDKFFSPWMFQDIRLSPGARYLSFRSNAKGNYGLFVYDLETEKKVSICPSSTSDDQVSDIQWVDGDSIVYTLKDGWNFYKEANVIKADLKHPKALENLDEKSSYIITDPLPGIEDKCLVLVYDWARKLKKFPDAQMLDLNKRIPHVVAKNPGNIVDWQADTKGVVRLGIAKVEDGGRIFKYRSDEGSEWMDLSIPGHTEALTFDPSGKYLMVSTTGKDGDNYGLGTWNIETQNIAGKVFFDAPYDVGTSENGTLIKDPASGVVVGLMYNADKQRFLWFDPGYKRVATALDSALPGMTNEIIGFTKDKSSVFIRSYSDRDPGGVYRLDLTTGKMKALFFARPGIKPSEMCEMKPISFTAEDGATIYGYLTLPKASSTKLPPLITVIHGGPQSRDVWEFNDEVQYFAALGYAVLQVNYRGSVGMGRNYKGFTIEQATRCVVTDVADGVKWVLDQKLADPNRVAIYGISFGGTGALAGAEQHPELYKVAIGFAGVYDWEAMRKEDIRNQLTSTDRYYSEDPEILAKIDASSAIHFVDKVKCPVMLFHGTGDRNVPISQSKDMASALEKAGVDVKLETKTWVGHGFNDPEKRKKFYLSVTKFLEEKMP